MSYRSFQSNPSDYKTRPGVSDWQRALWGNGTLALDYVNRGFEAVVKAVEKVGDVGKFAALSDVVTTFFVRVRNAPLHVDCLTWGGEVIIVGVAGAMDPWAQRDIFTSSVLVFRSKKAGWGRAFGPVNEVIEVALGEDVVPTPNVVHGDINFVAVIEKVDCFPMVIHHNAFFHRVDQIAGALAAHSAARVAFLEDAAYETWLVKKSFEGDNDGGCNLG